MKGPRRSSNRIKVVVETGYLAKLPRSPSHLHASAIRLASASQPGCAKEGGTDAGDISNHDDLEDSLSDERLLSKTLRASRTANSIEHAL